MSESTATRARPVSPHLQIYKFTPTYVMSGAHRITGMVLYFGTLLVAWWLIAAAASPQWFDLANTVMGSWFGLLVLFGFTWTMWHHLLGGVRHLIWDTGRLLDKQSSTRMAWVTITGSVLLTVLTWAVILTMVRG
jgi:succinate dehydrogenase / fumarate reductase cytochrome b subunit